VTPADVPDEAPGRPRRDGREPAAADPSTAAATLSARRFRTFDSVIDVPAFRWYLLSMTGNWSAMQMQQVARSFLAYQITGSFAALGFVELANSAPRVLLSLYGGVVADRSSRRVIIQIGQAFSASTAVVIAALLFLDMLRFEHLVLMALLQGIVNSFALPARQSMIPEVVGVERLMNAFALNVFSLNMMRLVAPGLAGIIIAVAGPAWVFTLMAFLNLLASVTMFRVPKVNAAQRAATREALEAAAESGAIKPRRGGVHGSGGRGGRASLQDIRDALSYLRGQRVLMWLLVIHGLSSMLALPYQRLLSGFVDEVLSSNADETALLMGWLLTATAVGALAGSLLIASMSPRRRGLLLIGSLVVFGTTMLAFAASTNIWLSLGIVMILGIGQAGRQSLVSILIQTGVDDAFRGRISSIMQLEDGIESLGIFMIALLAEAVGPQIALGSVALTMLAMAALLFATRTIRTLQ